jgi:hypothetical protein
MGPRGGILFISFSEHITDRDLSNHENNKDTYKYF